MCLVQCDAERHLPRSHSCRLGDASVFVQRGFHLGQASVILASRTDTGGVRCTVARVSSEGLEAEGDGETTCRGVSNHLEGEVRTYMRAYINTCIHIYIHTQLK